ncbi:MAG: plastocyanin/azurin family copper-binding protein [Candidatus Caldarchaeales archaeon]|nr:plastocyanin/azurin family copper-binding protein [Candidatus Caldarchaeales archaeon]
MVSKAFLAGVAVAVVAVVVVVVFLLQGPGTGVGGKVWRIVSMKGSYIPPEGWKFGDPPVISDRFFNPSRLTINVGDIVEYVNEDETPHTFTSLKVPPAASRFDSGPVDPGKSFRYTFKVTGDYTIYCTLHPHKGVEIAVR